MMKRSAGTKPDKAKNINNPSQNKIFGKGLTKRGLKRILMYAGGALGFALLVSLVLFLTRPKLVWFVDAEYSAAWNRILREKFPRSMRYEVMPNTGNNAFPDGRFGFTVSRNGPEGEPAQDAPVVFYRDLSRTREYNNWITLALDPWMVFRKHQDPEPARSFLNNSNERGTLLLAGLDQKAVNAWLSQVMQVRPGIFVNVDWNDKGQSLTRDYPFQSGAFTYSWVQVWPMLFRSEVSYLYAPFSQARALPPYRSGLLDATLFPEPPEWDRYGMQADILWARRENIDGILKKIIAKIYGLERSLHNSENWLKDPNTQTFIANTIEWIPAHPSGVPYNTISWETQMAWLRSSYIWQGANDAQDS